MSDAMTGGVGAEASDPTGPRFVLDGTKSTVDGYQQLVAGEAAGSWVVRIAPKYRFVVDVDCCCETMTSAVL